MPQPRHVQVIEGAPGLVIDTGFTAAVDGAGASDPRIAHAIPRFLAQLTRETGIFVRSTPVPAATHVALLVTVQHPDHAAPQRLGDDEAYKLTLTEKQARLTASTPLGVLRGLQTLLQLVGPGKQGFAIPAVEIDDAPRFAWRGLSLDVARHFIPVADVERTLDGMSAVKLNVLHWHLSDDQGFRVESKIFPKLQRIASEGQYYTQAQIRDVVAYARDRGIRVVPEIDMPGHATAMLAAYPELGSGAGPYQIIHEFGIFTPVMDPTRESTYTFVDKLIGEIAALFPDQYFHIGGDEVKSDEWEANDAIQRFMTIHHIEDGHALQAFFNRRVQKIVAQHHKVPVGWEEVLDASLPKALVVESWHGQDSLAAAAKQGFRGILAHGYYLDLMQPAAEHYAVDPMTGATSELSAAEQQRVLGGEAAMWEELATPHNLDMKLWPRLAAIAERFWSPQDVSNIDSMYRRLDATSRWLESYGLRHNEIPREMQERLAGPQPAAPLRIFASTLEPVKEYTRTDKVGGYTTSTPLNRLVDSVPPESDAARAFARDVDRFLNGASDGARVMQQLQRWSDNVPRVRPVLESNKLLLEAVPVADSERTLCEAGLRAVEVLRQNDLAARDVLKRSSASVDQAAESTKAEVVIAIAPPIQRLVKAAMAGSNE